jgi:hypothetical protein
MDIINAGWRDQFWLLVYLETSVVHVQFELCGWTVTASVSDWLPDCITLRHPDTRCLGFWFEDFEFDRYPSETDTVLEETECDC